MAEQAARLATQAAAVATASAGTAASSATSATSANAKAVTAADAWDPQRVRRAAEEQGLDHGFYRENLGCWKFGPRKIGILKVLTGKKNDFEGDVGGFTGPELLHEVSEKCVFSRI